MADTLILAGIYANILSRPNTTLSASQTPSALYPITRVTDGRPSQEFLFPAVAANDYVQADINQVLNADFESWPSAGNPEDWTPATTNDGAVTEETTAGLVVGGTGSGLRLTNGTTGSAEVSQDVQFMSGEALRLDTYARTDDAAEPTELEIQNLQTGMYLNSSGTWQSGQTNARQETSTSLTQSTLDFTVEDFATTRSHLVTLRIRIHMDNAAASKQHNWDDVLIYPAANFASIHGHNIDPSVTVELHSDSDSAFGTLTDHGDFTVAVPSFYLALASLQRFRYWRVPQFTGTNSTVTGALALGEAVLGQSTALQRAPRHGGLEVAEEIPQEALESRVSGEQWRAKRARYKQRVLRLAFRHTTAMQTQFSNELVDRTNDGVDPIVCALQRSPLQSDIVVHARKPRGQSFRIEGGDVEQTELRLFESPFGVLLD